MMDATCWYIIVMCVHERVTYLLFELLVLQHFAMLSRFFFKSIFVKLFQLPFRIYNDILLIETTQ